MITQWLPEQAAGMPQAILPIIRLPNVMQLLEPAHDATSLMQHFPHLRQATLAASNKCNARLVGKRMNTSNHLVATMVKNAFGRSASAGPWTWVGVIVRDGDCDSWPRGPSRKKSGNQGAHNMECRNNVHDSCTRGTHEDILQLTPDLHGHNSPTQNHRH